LKKTAFVIGADPQSSVMQLNIVIRQAAKIEDEA